MTGLVSGHWMTLGAVLVFGVYSIILAGIGYVGFQRTGDIRGFALGRHSVRGVWVGISFGATYASANMFIGVPGLGYTHGTAALWWTTLGFGLPFLALVAVSKRAFRAHGGSNTGSLTLPEWIGVQYQSPRLRVGTGLVSLFLLFYVAGQLVGAATLFETLFGFSYFVGAFIAFVLSVMYVSAGGMYSTLLTDVFQGIVMSVIAVISFTSLAWVLDVNLLRVPTQVISNLHTTDPSLTTPFSEGSVLFGGPIALLGISWLLFLFVLLPHLLNRIYVLESEQDLAGFIIGAGVSLWLLSSLMIWIGLAGRFMFPALSYSDAVVPEYIVRVFPGWAALLMLIGILSAMLTTADSLLQALGSIIANDIYQPAIEYIPGYEPNRRTQLWVARLGIILIGFGAFVTATTRPESLFLLTQIGITGLLSGLSIPILVGYFWPNAPRRGAEWGFVTGTTLYLILFPTGIIESQFTTLLIASVGNSVAFVLISHRVRTVKNKTQTNTTTQK